MWGANFHLCTVTVHTYVNQDVKRGNVASAPAEHCFRSKRNCFQIQKSTFNINTGSKSYCTAADCFSLINWTLLHIKIFIKGNCAFNNNKKA